MLGQRLDGSPDGDNAGAPGHSDEPFGGSRRGIHHLDLGSGRQRGQLLRPAQRRRRVHRRGRVDGGHGDFLHKSDLETGATAYLRVRSSGGTGDQERLMSGWSSPIRGMSATPVTPPAPTGLNSTSGDDSSISWSWNAVDGATGYQVQVSMSEDFSDAETVDLDADTTSHSVDVDAGSTRYLRVRATGMGDPSGWATHVTGMSNPPEAAPEPTPDPVTVTFSLSDDAKSPHFMGGGQGRRRGDREGFGEQRDHGRVEHHRRDHADVRRWRQRGQRGRWEQHAVHLRDWDLLQSDVLDGGATFMVQRTTVGANQEMEPSGDVAYVTCGPFECADGSDAPMLSIENSGVCTAWDPTVEIQVGKVDNDVVNTGTDEPLDNATDALTSAS